MNTVVCTVRRPTDYSCNFCSERVNNALVTYGHISSNWFDGIIFLHCDNKMPILGMLYFILIVFKEDAFVPFQACCYHVNFLLSDLQLGCRLKLEYFDYRKA